MPKVDAAYLKIRTGEILAAAAACFARSGYRGASMADIAKEAGLSVGALYRYYDTKESLFEALAKTARESNIRLWKEVSTRDGHQSQLIYFIDQFFQMATDPKCKPSLMLDIRMRSAALDLAVVRRELRSSYKLQVGNVAKLLAGIHGPAGDSAAMIAMATSLIGALNEASLQILMIKDFDVDQYRSRVISMYCGDQ